MRTTQRFAIAAVLATLVLGVPIGRAVGGETTAAALPPEKLAMQQRIERAHADALAAPHAAKDIALTLAASAPEPAWLTGIIDSGQAPLPGSRFVIENQWHDIVAGEHVNVYAGADREHPASGVVVVDVTALDFSAPASRGGVYPTPEAAGTVRIIEAIGGKLVLLSSTGARFSFDVAARAYV